MTPLLTKLLVVGSALAVFFVGKICFHFKDDNPVEEVAELVIKQETGIDIDLTPISKEIPAELIDNKDTSPKI